MIVCIDVQIYKLGALCHSSILAYCRIPNIILFVQSITVYVCKINDDRWRNDNVRLCSCAISMLKKQSHFVFIVNIVQLIICRIVQKLPFATSCTFLSVCNKVFWFIDKIVSCFVIYVSGCNFWICCVVTAWTCDIFIPTDFCTGGFLSFVAYFIVSKGRNILFTA